MAEHSSSMHIPMVSIYYIPAVLPVILVVFLLRKIVRRLRAHSIAQLPGPPPGPWLVGNLPEILRPAQVAKVEFEWIREYGTCLRIKGAFSEDIMWISDPKAMQYILNTGGYNFPKPRQSAVTSKLLVGKGITYVQGLDHARHRKVMIPAFSYSALKGFLPLFREIMQKTSAKWKDQIAQSSNPGMVVNISEWFARTTLDVIGEAGFDYKFGALEDKDNELSRVYRSIFVDTFFNRSDFTIAFEALWGYIPLCFIDLMYFLPIKQLATLRSYMKISRSYAKDVLDAQTRARAAGKQDRKDVMSILIRANLSENPKSKLSEEELMAQLTSLMFAGHETTASTATWTIYELSRHPEIQSQVREEIKATRARAALRGDGELTIADLDSMKYLLAVLKETLRYHPILPLLHRAAGRDDVIPLSTPLTTKAGEVITSVPVSKGQRLTLSLAAYNRLESVWGDDADVWNPARFLNAERTQKTTVGVISNISSFSSGLRSCLGWRFAMLELQEMCIEFLGNFEFSPAPGNPEIVRGATFIMVPMVKGSEDHVELPITVTPLL